MTHFILFDGECGLCHLSVSFTLKRDREEKFHYCPLQWVGETELRESLGDTIVLVTAEGMILTKSDAALFVLRELPGVWPALGGIGSLFPKFLRNGVYDLVASIRKKVFPTPKELCPIVPSELASRFLSVDGAEQIRSLMKRGPQ